jgi:hypothetical protein
VLATYSVDVQTDTSPFERLLSNRNVVPKAKFVLQASILSSSLCSQTLEQQKLLAERATEAMATVHLGKIICPVFRRYRIETPGPDVNPKILVRLAKR